MLIGLLLLYPTPAQARSLHASLLRADPAANSVQALPPSRLLLVFSEPVQPIVQTITVMTPSGQQIIHGAVKISGNQLEMGIDARSKGSYLVSWQVLSQDTQPVSGKYIFSVGQPGGPWANSTGQEQLPFIYTVLQAVAQLLHFLGYALGFGVLAFLWLIVYPLQLSTVEEIQDYLLRLAKYGIALLVLAEPLALLAQSMGLTASQGLSFDIIGGLLATNFGWLLSLRLGAALVLWILVGAIQQGAKKGVRLACLVGILLALIDSFSSHATGSRAPWISLLAHMVHLISMGLWIGGLSSLTGLWRHQRLLAQKSVLLTRFGYLATTAVAELFISGVIISWLQFTSISNLITTNYGRVLLIKLIIFLAILFILALFRRARKQPIIYWWILEEVALIGILILAGILLSLSPPLLTR
ncbi:hypothetical protein KDK_63630 [Dictyobacter kobayashii]|uniref:CopC domain-containing protein n=1 Tax=Dictyobacter kobayashii TaxID=2014872 RepID=A0A402AU51_9CHLR|nr:hypothetical protein KDK_63630 [Dictyobacter kobayashii]